MTGKWVPYLIKGCACTYGSGSNERGWRIIKPHPNCTADHEVKK